MIPELISHTHLLLERIRSEKQVVQPTIIVGLSGGPDSCFLLQLLHNLRATTPMHVVAAHLDHEWRAESAADVEFCKALCDRYDMEFVSKKASALPITKRFNGSKEELGRTLRRSFYHQVVTHYNAHAIALGHHLNDQHETFFIRLLRGTSLSGLQCMKDWDGLYLRPLLGISKQTILNYLDSHKLSYLIDSTNESDAFLRNRIRHHLIPALATCDTRFDQSLTHTIRNLSSENDFLERCMLQAFNHIFSSSTDINLLPKQNIKSTRPVRAELVEAYERHSHPSTTLRANGFAKNSIKARGDLALFQKLDPVIARRVLLHWLITEQVPFTPSHGLLQEIMRFLLSATGGTHHINPTTIIHKKQSHFWIER